MTEEEGEILSPPPPPPPTFSHRRQVEIIPPSSADDVETLFAHIEPVRSRQPREFERFVSEDPLENQVK